MPAINSENREAWQALANEVSKDRPYVGRRVTVTGGRKHKGKSGEVVRHERDRYVDAFRYGNEAQHHMTQMRGRYGYVVLIDTGTERFWTKADNVTCQP